MSEPTDVIISGRGLLRKYNELRAKGYTTVWRGEGRICLKPPITCWKCDSAITDAEYLHNQDGTTQHVNACPMEGA